jgi:hypothetical protein
VSDRCPIDMLSKFASEQTRLQCDVRRDARGQLQLCALVRLELPEQERGETPLHYLEKLAVVLAEGIRVRDVPATVDCPRCHRPQTPEQVFSYGNRPAVCARCRCLPLDNAKEPSHPESPTGS